VDIKLITFTPNPEEVCARAAWNCTHTEEPDFKEGEAEALVRRVVALGHTSILEFADFVFEIKGISRVTSHQLIRHRIASYAQQSQRYNTYDTLDVVIPHSMLLFEDRINQINELTLKLYKDMLLSGVPGEDARYIFPHNTKTSLFVKMNARTLREFFALRCCKKAQQEIQDMANCMYKLAQEAAPALFSGKIVPCGTKKECARCPGYGLK